MFLVEKWQTFAKKYVKNAKTFFRKRLFLYIVCSFVLIHANKSSGLEKPIENVDSSLSSTSAHAETVRWLYGTRIRV